jgi:hypothetical protein
MSTAALVRNTVTFRPAVRPPFAIVKPTDREFVVVPCVITTTRSLPSSAISW